MVKKKTQKDDPIVIDLNFLRIKKKVLAETDPDYREEVEYFLDKYKKDTLTGL